MARDIEEFLRRAAERRQQQQNKQRGPAPSQRVRDIVEKAEVEVVQPVEIVKPRRQKQPRKSRVAEVRDLRHQTVEDHVRTHIDSTDIAEHAEHLGDRIQMADDRIASRVSQKFDIDVSRIDDLPTVQDDEVAKVTKVETAKIVQDLVQMLRSPNSVRNAVLIAEILHRPSFDR